MIEDSVATREPVTQKAQRTLKVFFLTLAVFVGAIQSWHGRHTMDPDGMAYLDMATAGLRGDWASTINAYWSPLYPWLLAAGLWALKPSPYWEFAVAHLVNFLIYLGSLASFHFFLRELLRYHERQAGENAAAQSVVLPGWAVFSLGYSLFISSVMQLIPIWWVGPDLLVTVFVYLASGLILKARERTAGWVAFVLLGAVLGFGYLAKTPMFPIAFLFLAVGLFSTGSVRLAFPRIISALVVFLLIGGPFIYAISKSKGRLTIGDSAKLTYAWTAGGARKQPKHVGTISNEFVIRKFDRSSKGTYPIWYDPSYWYEGTKIRGNFIKNQLGAFVRNATRYFMLFFNLQNGLVVGFLILFLMNRHMLQNLRRLVGHWHLFVPALGAMGMYAMVFVTWRYIGAFVVLLWLGLACSITISNTEEAKRFARIVCMAILLVMTIKIFSSNAEETVIAARELIHRQETQPHLHWQIARELKQLGVQPGDRVASIGYSAHAYWAHLAQIQFAAEIPEREQLKFWNATPAVRAKTIKVLANTGAKIVVARKLPSHIASEGWQRIGDTEYYVYLLAR